MARFQTSVPLFRSLPPLDPADRKRFTFLEVLKSVLHYTSDISRYTSDFPGKLSPGVISVTLYHMSYRNIDGNERMNDALLPSFLRLKSISH